MQRPLSYPKWGIHVARKAAPVEPTIDVTPETTPGALIPIAEHRPSEAVLMFERLAKDPNVDVGKLERIIEMQERILAHNAKSAFNAAFAEMQADIPTVTEHGRTDKGSYAQLEDIIEAVRPVLKAHGFSLSHQTEWPDKSTVKVIGILTHRDGHERRSEFLSSADASGSKNAIQALGSAVAYGRRYTTKDLLNIATRGEDDDGRRAAEKPKNQRGQAARKEPLVANNPDGKLKISQGQVTRFWSLARKAKRTPDEVKAFLAVAYHIDSTTDILRDDYEAICTALEHPGRLQTPREPGSDDE